MVDGKSGLLAGTAKYAMRDMNKDTESRALEVQKLWVRQLRELFLRFLQDRSGRHFSAQSDAEWEERRLDEICRTPDAKVEKAGIMPPILLALIIVILYLIART